MTFEEYTERVNRRWRIYRVIVWIVVIFYACVVIAACLYDRGIFYFIDIMVKEGLMIDAEKDMIALVVALAGWGLCCVICIYSAWKIFKGELDE